jgi:hypothetical protein
VPPSLAGELQTAARAWQQAQAKGEGS